MNSGIVKPEKRFHAFCTSCGWKGQRMEKSADNPCPKCNSKSVVLAGSDLPISRDPAVIARLLDSDPELHWRVLRALESRRLIGPWTPVGMGYWERVAFDGERVASITVELGGFNWETSSERGSAVSAPIAMNEADEVLTENAIEHNWRILNLTLL